MPPSTQSIDVINVEEYHENNSPAHLYISWIGRRCHSFSPAFPAGLLTNAQRTNTIELEYEQ